MQLKRLVSRNASDQVKQSNERVVKGGIVQRLLKIWAFPGLFVDFIFSWFIVYFTIDKFDNRKEEGRVCMHQSIPPYIGKAQRPAKIDSQQF